MNVSPSSDALPASFDDAVAFLREYAADALMPSGERVVEHALGTARITESLRVDTPTAFAAVLFELPGYHEGVEALIAQRFGAEVAQLVNDVGKLLRLGAVGARAQAAPVTSHPREARAAQAEALRKMLLAFSQDIRAVLVRLASRVQTLRYYATARLTPPAELPRETLEVYAPLANRLGIWQLKWELEDLAFRFEEADTYRRIASLLDEKRIERESFIAAAIARLRAELAAASVQAEVSGRPKHIYSIWRKMRGKALDFSELYDVRAFRVIVEDVKDCYTVLGIVHNLWQPIPQEFDDYVSRPKANGYRSLHTVVIGDDGRAFEVQIRTRDMHRFAEYGVAAHWRYKEAGTKGYVGQFAAADSYDAKIAWLRQLLAWKDDVATGRDSSRPAEMAREPWEQLKQASIDDQIYVLTPHARILALPRGATPVDFAYHVHTELGHRCRGARVDGAMVPLNTPLHTGQTVEILSVKQGGPSRDWLNPQLGYLHSPRVRAKVRAWFNAVEQQESIALGRAAVEKTLQREGKTSVNLDELAVKLGFKSADDLFIQVAKDEVSPRSVEHALRDPPSSESTSAQPVLLARESSGASVARGGSGGVLVSGVGALLTQFARCCRPAPPDPIVGFITRGKGMSIHRGSCPSFRRLAQQAPERVMPTAWSDDVLEGRGGSVYPIDLLIEAADRQGLLRDISEVFAREKINVIGVNTQSRQHIAHMQFTVEVVSVSQVQRACQLLREIPGVERAGRKV